MCRSTTMCFFIIICLLSVFSLIVNAANSYWDYTIIDKVGDDYGPGNYLYPQNEIFSPYEGLFDLVKFSIKESENNYILNFEFTKLSDPWNSKYGFSLPLIELYIDNQEGGAKKIIEKGAKLKLDQEHPWNKMIKLSGWWLMLYDHTAEVEEKVNISSDIRESKWQVKECEIESHDNIIEVKLPQSVLGEMKNSYVQIIIGSFDPFGPGHFRDISTGPSSWKFHVVDIDNLENMSRVIDTVVPEGMNQKEVLTPVDNNYPSLQAVQLKESINPDYHIIRSPFLYLALLVVITSGIFIKRKM